MFPLDEYRNQINSLGLPKISAVTAADQEEHEIEDGDFVTVAGIVSSLREKLTRSNTTMAYMTLEDFTGGIEVIVFPKLYSRIGEIIRENNIVVVTGRVDIKEDERPKLIMETAAPFSENAQNRQSLCLELALGPEELAALDKVRQAVAARPGQIPIVIAAPQKRIPVLPKYRCDGSDDLVYTINNIFGRQCASIK